MISVEFARSGKTMTAAENESPLAIANAAGIAIYGPHAGRDSATCGTRPLDGRMEVTCEPGLDP